MNGESIRYDKLESMLESGSSKPHNVPLKYLRNITNNFSDERLLGEGGFGMVYKGVLQNGEMIAVKKLNSSIPGVRDKQFENEANHLMRLKHPNVVLLVGWCWETENSYVEYNGKYICAEKSERLLCLEYMPKGNLREYLSDELSGLDWDTRYKIIEGICYGLCYLHEQYQPIVHMDLKPANILLDNNMVPKIADFGMSRLFSEEKTWTLTISRDGTLGYMSPEYINRGLISTKSDIFSLGVIIMEIVTGRRDYPDDTGTPSEEYIETVLHNWSQRKGIKSLFGVSLEVDYQQIKRCIQIGLDCVKTDRSKRPTISQIIKALHRPESADSSNIKGVTTVLREAGLESFNLILGIDFTKSNEWSGRHSFGRKSLHAISGTPNPYEQAISIIGRTLLPFDDGSLIPCFGFGDASTHDRSVFSFYPENKPCRGFQEVVGRYRQIVPHLKLSGPTSFAPLIYAAISVVENSNWKYHVLVIIADGQVNKDNRGHGSLSPQEQATIQAIVDASHYPLSIIMVGVGDGPWYLMQHFHDCIPERAFDNFQFVNFTDIMTRSKDMSSKEAAFTLAALREIPSQYKATQGLRPPEKQAQRIGAPRILPPNEVLENDNAVASHPPQTASSKSTGSGKSAA